MPLSDDKLESRPAAGGETLLITERGLVQIAEFDRGVSRHTCVGAQGGPMAKAVIAVGERALARHGRCVYMVDNWDGSLMETAFRETMTEWLQANAPNVLVHMLLRSKLLEMGLALANLVLRNRSTFSYSAIAEWEDAGRRESGREDFRRVPIEIPADLTARFRRK